MSTTVKDTVSVDLENMTATVTSDCREKYARQLIQIWLKEHTPFKSGWTVWREGEEDGLYHYTLANYEVGLSHDKINKAMMLQKIHSSLNEIAHNK